jgi:hypothetical protein
LVAVLAAVACTSGSAPGDPSAPDAVAAEEAALKSLSGLHSDSAVVLAWSKKSHDIAFAEDEFLTFKGHRAFAMMHIAMHDALNAIVPFYRQYSRIDSDPLAHPLAAAAQAAHDVLRVQYPDERAELERELGRWLSRVPENRSKRRGIDLGKRSAGAILTRRADDGWNFQGSYTFADELGTYQTTPPWDGFVAQPGFRSAKPFALEASAQFRPQPPPPLDSAEYAAAFNEVKHRGRVNSGTRSPDETHYAVWWMEFAEGSINRLARELATERRTHLWRAARLFALLNVSLFDGYIAVWDAKYEYNHFRPYTAVREAGRDPNPETVPDPSWEPLRATPPTPEYISAHAAACGASFEILRRTFGGHVSFTMQTTTAPPERPIRSFHDFDAAVDECADSRVQLGWHFRCATDAGVSLGRSVAAYIAGSQLEPDNRSLIRFHSLWER